MIKCISILIVILFTIPINFQTKENKLKLHSANVGFGGFYFKKNSSESGGITFIADLTTSLNQNLISTSYLTGAKIGILGSSTYNFNELSLQYGREIKIRKWLSFELFAGLGYYIQKSDASYILNDNSISYPLKLNSNFYINKKIGLGINANYSINRVNNNLSANLIFHFRFN
ncbi:MAG: hypothetical protein ACPGUH_01855 [Winogradskyella sp.]